MNHSTLSGLRRGLSLLAAAAIGAGALAVTTPTAYASVDAECTISATPGLIGYGDFTDFDLVDHVGDRSLTLVMTIDGHLVREEVYTGELASMGLGFGYDYVTDEFGAVSSAGFRAFPADVDVAELTDESTPLCEGYASLGNEPTGPEVPTDPAGPAEPEVCDVTFTPSSIDPGEEWDLSITTTEPGSYDVYWVRDGQLVGYWGQGGMPLPNGVGGSYEWLHDTYGVDETFGIRVYEPHGSTEGPPLCEGTLTLEPGSTTPTDPTPYCDVQSDVDAIAPGESATLTLTRYDDYELYYALVADGHIVPQFTGQTGTDGFSDQAQLPYEMLAAAGATGSGGIRFYAPDLDPRTITDETEAACQVTVDLTTRPSTPTTPTAPTVPAPAPVLEKAALTLKTPAGLPLSAKTAAVRTRSNGKAPVTLASATPKVCRVTGADSVKLIEAGECRLSASQGADDAHLAADPATASFPVWGAPSLPAKARSTKVLDVLGKGEQSYRVVAAPADVCRATDGAVALIDGGVCRVEVRSGGHVVRADKVKVTVPAKPASAKHSMDIGATVYFAFDSARLTAEGKATLRKVAPKLRKADLVVVYGHTYGPGKNSKASRALAAERARVSVAFLADLGVKSKAVSEVAMAMQQPTSHTAWKNRRAEVYYR